MADDISAKVLDHLVEEKRVSSDRATELRQLMEAGDSLHDLVVKTEEVDAQQFAQAYAAASGMNFVDLSDMTVPKELLAIIPESTARGHMIVAFAQNEQGLQVAMANPGDRQIVEFIHKKVDMPVQVSIASEESIRLVIEQYQVTLEVELQDLVRQAQAVQRTENEGEAAEDLPIIKITEAILKHAILRDASDIHIEPTEKEVVIRYRVDGMLHDVLTLPKVVIAGMVARIKVLATLKIDEHRLPQDGRFKMQSDDFKVAFRVSVLPVFDGEKVVMRLLDESGQGLGLDELGMSERTVKIFRDNITKPHGMVLVTGPTGSGKTTTLYGAMKELNQPEVNICTIEDPIEYRMERINQTQVKPKIGLTFSNGLRALVRQDPDIIMVGEIRDEETASLAVNAALTGHLVLSTLHTNSAAGAIPRLVDMKVEPFLIASTTNLLAAQRLVRKLCEECRQEAPMGKGILESIDMVIDSKQLLELMKREGAVEKSETWENMTVYVPQGCDKCSEGYRGRVGIYEVIEVTPEIQKLITSNVTSKELENAAREQQQMVTMIEDGMMKVITGATPVSGPCFHPLEQNSQTK